MKSAKKIPRFWKKKNVLVTGGMGFIGSNLIRRLVEWGAHVTLVDSLLPQYGGNPYNIAGIEGKIKVNISDIRDQHRLPFLVKNRDFIFNFAGQTSHLDSMEDPFTDLEINCTAQLSLLEACRKHNRHAKIVFASTRQIYGKPTSLPVDESHLLQPTDVNGINKMAGEWYHILYHRVYGLQTCALRLTNVYGPRMRIKDARQTFIGVWIRNLLENKPIEVWGGNQKRDFIYIDDLVDLSLRVAQSPKTNGMIYNVGGTEVISLRNLAKLMISLNEGGKIKVKPFPKERKRIDIGDYYSNDQLIRKALKWTSRVDLQEGLARTLDYFRHHGKNYV